MGNAATIDIRGDNRKLKSAFDDSAGLASAFGSKVTGILGAAGAAMAAAFSIHKLVSWGAGFLAAANEAAEAEAVLSAALEATGNQTGFTLEQLNALSLGMQRTTKFSQEAAQGAMAVITTFKNVRGDHFKEATELAADMATVMKGDLQGAAMQVAKALNDPIQGINALKRSGVSFSDEQEKMIKKMVEAGDVMGAQRMILDELQSEFGGAAEKVGKTFGGQMEIMYNRVGDLAEGMGNHLIPIIEALGPAIDGVVNFMENMVDIIGDSAKGWILFAQVAQDAVAPFFEFLVDVGIASFSVLQTLFENFTTTTDALISTWVLGLVRSFEDVKHYLTVILPDVLSWFAENWSEIFTDVATFTGTVLTNMGQNIASFVEGVKSFLTGGGMDFKFTSLTEGFESTLTELPKIAERIPSAFESALEAKVDAVNERLTNTFGNNFIKNKKALQDMFQKRDEKDVDLTPKAVDAPFVHDEKKDTSKQEAAQAKKLAALLDKRKELLDKLNGEADSSGGGIEDFKSLHNRIQSAAAGTGNRDKVLKDQLKIQEELLKVNKAIEAHGGDAMANWAAALQQSQKDKEALNKDKTPEQKAIELDKSLDGSEDWWKEIQRAQEATAFGVQAANEQATQEATKQEETGDAARQLQTFTLGVLKGIFQLNSNAVTELREHTRQGAEQIGLLPKVGALR